MKVRRRSLAVPAIALLGILLALWFLARRRTTPALPEEIILPISAAKIPSQPSIQQAPAAAAKPTENPPPPSAPQSEKKREETQAQMKAELSSLYGSEKAFFAEYQRYSTDLNAIGYTPTPGRLRAKAGFLRAFNPDTLVKAERPEFMSFEDPEFHAVFTPEAESAHLSDAARYCHQGCTASDTGFEIAIITTTDGKPDVWTINQSKVLTHETAPAPNESGP